MSNNGFFEYLFAVTQLKNQKNVIQINKQRYTFFLNYELSVSFFAIFSPFA